MRITTNAVAAASAVAVIASVAGTAWASSSEPPHRTPPACVTFVVSGQPPVGMPWDEPVTFCGAGMQPGTWTCPAKSPAIGPGTTLKCRKQ